MATKRGRKELDWGSIARNAIEAATPEELEKTGAAVKFVDKFGLDRFWAALTAEQRRELAKRAKGTTK